MSMKNVTNKLDFTKKKLTLDEVDCSQYDKSLKDEGSDGLRNRYRRWYKDAQASIHRALKLSQHRYRVLKL